ncbi:MAG: gntR [Haloplasmataceae bacterium]|nr:gntR [Haloplasmataceae bacterium]
MEARNVPAYIEIYNDLFSKIMSSEYKMGDKLPTEKELCDIYFVSRITVQKALQKLVDKGLLARISGKGTFVSSANSSKPSKKKTIIGVIMCNISPSYGVNILKSIEKYAANMDYSIIFKNSYHDREKETIAIRDLIELGVEGIILQPMLGEMFNPEILKLSLREYPIVLIDRNLTGLSLPFVGSDNRYITEKVMDNLFENGHKNICFMSSIPKNTTSIEERLEAFNNSFIRNKVINTVNNVYTNIYSNSCAEDEINNYIKQDIENIKNYLLDNPQITCVFTSEFAICSIVKKAINSIGKKIPDDISVLTFDNISESIYFTNTSYIKQDEEAIGKYAVELLNDAITGEKKDVKRYLPTEFIKGTSIKNLNEIK